MTQDFENEEKLTKSGRIDGRCFNGGARKGAGRPRKTMTKKLSDFWNETVIVLERRGPQMRRVKKSRYESMLDTQFSDNPFKKGHKRMTNFLLKVADIPDWEPPRTKKKAKRIIPKNYDLMNLKFSAKKEQKRWEKPWIPDQPPTPKESIPTSKKDHPGSNISEETFRAVMERRRRNNL